MPNYWTVPLIWEGRCFIIGGGASLSSFDFDKLEKYRVIGTNESYKLGRKICDFICFCDLNFYLKNKIKMEERYTGLFITNCKKLKPESNRIKVCERVINGWGTGSRLGFYQSTGSTSINLAVSLGATEIILLGFDNDLSKEGKENWNKPMKNRKELNIGKITVKAYYDSIHRKFQRGINRLIQDMERYCPNVKIINANPESKLEGFEKRPIEEIL